MFRPGEKVCVSPDKFGYHCLPLESTFSGNVTLVSQNPKIPESRAQTDDLLLVSLNPSKGFREDNNCTSYRNFLIEMDTGSSDEQMHYIYDQLRMPFSAAIFSGNKSLHFLISLSSDLPNEKIYRHFAEWILNIATLADQMTKNPSRSIRIPGAFREPGKQQKLVQYNGSVDVLDLVRWLGKYPNARPKKREKKISKEDRGMDKVKYWVRKRIKMGLDPTKGRNIQWYSIAYEFALAGYSEESTIIKLGEYFSEDKDFKEREWLTTIKSAFKNANSNK